MFTVKYSHFYGEDIFHIHVYISQHTIYCTIHISQHTVYCTIHISQHTIYCTIHISQHTIYYTIHISQHTIYYTIHISQHTIYYTIHISQHTIYCTIHISQHTIYCTIHIIVVYTSALSCLSWYISDPLFSIPYICCISISCRTGFHVIHPRVSLCVALYHARHSSPQYISVLVIVNSIYYLNTGII